MSKHPYSYEIVKNNYASFKMKSNYASFKIEVNTAFHLTALHNKGIEQAMDSRMNHATVKASTSGDRSYVKW